MSTSWAGLPGLLPLPASSQVAPAPELAHPHEPWSEGLMPDSNIGKFAPYGSGRRPTVPRRELVSGVKQRTCFMEVD